MKTHSSFILMLAVASAGPAIAAPAASPPTAQATPDPMQLALAERVAASLWPDGTYGRMIDSMFGGKDGLTDMFLDMRPAELMGTFAEAMAEEGKPAADSKEKSELPNLTLREILIAQDPHFEERMRIMVQVLGDEVRRIAKPIEPKFRAGLSKSISRRFTRAQLEPIAAFLETEPGRAYAAQSMTMFIDKDVMLAMIQSLPTMIKEMPAAFKKVEAATAHLPKPKKEEPEKTDPDEQEQPET
jgi:hypothetical protein